MDTQRSDFRVVIDPGGRVSIYHELGRAALVDVQVGDQERRQVVPTHAVIELLMPEDDRT
jgi:hypothetical protein